MILPVQGPAELSDCADRRVPAALSSGPCEGPLRSSSSSNSDAGENEDEREDEDEDEDEREDEREDLRQTEGVPLVVLPLRAPVSAASGLRSTRGVPESALESGPLASRVPYMAHHSTQTLPFRPRWHTEARFLA